MRYQYHSGSILLALSIAAGLCLPAVAADQSKGFVAGTSVTLQARNYYFTRNFTDLVAPDQQSKSEEWAQGFIFDAKSGYTPGKVGFGVDLLGLLGIKLDSSADRARTGLLSTGSDGKSHSNYSRLGATLKARWSQTELKIGELRPDLPVLMFSDLRLLPPTYQGVNIQSREISGLTVQAGQLYSASLLNESGDGKMHAKLGHRPQLMAGTATDRFNYFGADYTFNDERGSAGVWYAQLQNLYSQRLYRVRHSVSVGDWVFEGRLGYFDSREDGDQLLGNIDNQAAASRLSAHYAGHTFLVGYQAMFGDDALPRVFNNGTPLDNEIPTFEFAGADERSWQLRYDYDFAAMGAPGLIAGVRFVKGDNVDVQATNGGGERYEGKEWERDLDIGYTVQSGLLKNLNIRVRNVTARSNYRTDIDENRLIFNYTWTLL